MYFKRIQVIPFNVSNSLSPVSKVLRNLFFRDSFILTNNIEKSNEKTRCIVDIGLSL